MRKVPDGRYGWIVVGACFLCFNVMYGIIFCYCILLIHFAENYDIPKGDLSSMGEFIGGCQLCFGPLTAPFSNKFGFRVTVIVGSVISVSGLLLCSFTTSVLILHISFCLLGIGFSHFYLPCLACASRYFSPTKPIAFAIVTLCFSTGCFIFPPLTNLLLKSFEFDGTMIMYGSLMLNCLSFGNLLRPINLQHQEKQQNQKYILRRQVPIISTIVTKEQEICYQEYTKYYRNCADFIKEKIILNITYSTVKRRNFAKTLKMVGKLLGLHHFKNIALSLYIAGACISLIPYVIIPAFLVHSAIAKYIETEKAIYLMSVFAIGNFVGNISCRLISTEYHICPIKLHNISIFAYGVLMIGMIICNCYAAMVLISAMIGFANASMVVFMPVLLVDYIGLPNLNSPMKLLDIFLGILWLAIPLGLGYMFDVSEYYEGVFYAAAISFLLIGIILEIISCLLKL